MPSAPWGPGDPMPSAPSGPGETPPPLLSSPSGPWAPVSMATARTLAVVSEPGRRRAVVAPQGVAPAVRRGVPPGRAIVGGGGYVGRMCVSTGRAEFSGTVLYVGRRRHPEHGLTHVLGYQNTAVNLGSGPNAMLLHIPAVSMSQRNFLSAGRSPDILRRMVDAVRPRGRAAAGSMMWMGGDDGGVEVFEHDVYTVLLADDPTLLPQALSRVPERKRPSLRPELMEFYAACYPAHTVLVCCFDNADARQAKPLLVRYQPLEPDLLVAPALDCHTGGVPDLGVPVVSDHWVLFGTDEAPAGWGSPVRYPPGMRHELREYLPERVIGAEYAGRELPNGDFAVSHEELKAGDLRRLPHRLQPAV